MTDKNILAVSGYNMFPRIYKMISHIADGDMGQIKIPGSDDMMSLADEAKEFLAVLDRAMDVSSMFPGMTKAKANKAFAALEVQYGFVIWTNKLAFSDEDCILRISENPLEHLTKSVLDIRQESYEACMETMEALKEAFEKLFPCEKRICRPFAIGNIMFSGT